MRYLQPDFCKYIDGAGFYSLPLIRACIASIVRIIPTAPMIHKSTSTKSMDPHYNTEWQRLWMFAEITLGFIVACALSLPELIRAKVSGGLGRRWSKSFGSSQSSERDLLGSHEWRSRAASTLSQRDWIEDGAAISKPERLSLAETKASDNAV